MKEVRMFDGEKFHISQYMLRESRCNEKQSCSFSSSWWSWSWCCCCGSSSVHGLGTRVPSAGTLSVSAAALIAVMGYFMPNGIIRTLGIMGAGCVAAVIGSCAALYTYSVCAPVKSRDKLVAAILTPVMANLDKNMKEVRTELLKRAGRGKVVDVGCGSGTYFKYVCNASLDEWVGVEPLKDLHPVLEKEVHLWANDAIKGFKGKTRLVHGDLDAIHQDENGTVDAVVLGNVLCEVPDVDETLVRVKALLKKGGRCYFSEHVYDEENMWRAVIQTLVSPWWRVVSGGCNADRRQLRNIKHAFGHENVCSWTLFAGSFPWTARFEVGLALKT